MKTNFRQLARESLFRAESEMGAGTEARLIYAALELRMAIEALTYDRAQAYQEEIAPSEYRTWQPKKVMQLLIDIEPTADKDSSVAVGLEEIPGTPATTMNFLGTEKVFGLKSIKDHYDALGSFVHLPNLKQLEEKGFANPTKVRERCTKIVELVKAVLASQVFNINFGVFTSIECMNTDCKQTVRRRIPSGNSSLKATCLHCNLAYEVTTDGDQCAWGVDLEKIPCPSPSCEEVFEISRSDLKPGRHFSCRSCGKRYEFNFGLLEAE